jgi:chromate reductase, NAD(P)H dehydrogenase (quinone)
MKIYSVAALVGSLRKESFSRKMAHALAALAPPSLKVEVVEIGALSLYNQDDEVSPPLPWTQFREKVRAMDALLFVTPEYNRSIPGVLKNAIDIGSRPYGKSVFNAKPGAVISISPGAMGGFGANQHLRQTLVFLNVPTLQQPEAYMSHADKLFDQEGRIAIDSTREFLKRFMQSFADWVATNAKN